MTDKTKYVLEITQAEADKIRAVAWEHIGLDQAGEDNATAIYDALTVDAQHEYGMFLPAAEKADYILELTQAEAETLRALMPKRGTVGLALAKVL